MHGYDGSAVPGCSSIADTGLQVAACAFDAAKAPSKSLAENIFHFPAICRSIWPTAVLLPPVRTPPHRPTRSLRMSVRTVWRRRPGPVVWATNHRGRCRRSCSCLVSSAPEVPPLRSRALVLSLTAAPTRYRISLSPRNFRRRLDARRCRIGLPIPVQLLDRNVYRGKPTV